MNNSTIMPRLKGFRFPHKTIAYAVWTYNRLALSTADIEDLLAARGGDHNQWQEALAVACDRRERQRV